MKVSKHTEMSLKSMGAAMFMFTIALYMIAGGLFALSTSEHFYYHVHFVFLIQGMIVSMAASAVFAISFGYVKSWNFLARYSLVTALLAALFGTSMLIFAANAVAGYHLWVLSGFIATFAMGTAFSIVSEKHFRSTGQRSVIIWELLK